MTASVSTLEPLRLEGRVRLALTFGLAAALFWVVGGQVLASTDPLAPATITGRPNVLTILGTLAALVAVASAVGASLMGRRPHAGALAVAVGLAVLALRFGSMERLLTTVGVDSAARKSAFGGLLIESLLWTALMALAVVVDAVTRRWLGSASASHLADTQSAHWAAGLLAVGIAATIAIIIISQFIARDATALINRKQVFFAIFISFFLGSLAATRIVSAAGERWLLLAPPVVAVLGYLWAWWEPTLRGQTYYDAIPHLPPNWLVRGLPIEYLGVGVAATVIGLWTARRATEPGAESEEP